MTRPASALTQHLGYWLRFVSNHVSHAFAAKVAAKGVTVAEWVVMRALYDVEARRPSQVASELGMTRGAITKLVDRLIEKRLVARRASREDGRAQSISLTPRGARLVPDLARLADENDDEFFGRLPPADRQGLQRLLERLVEDAKMISVPLE